MSAALTGPSKELGLQMKIGLETAFALANDSAMRELVEGKKVFAVLSRDARDDDRRSRDDPRPPSEHQGSHKVWGTVLNENAQYQSLDLE